MSVRMMVEVIDRAPRGLPDVQHRALIAIAERMNDRTRTGYHPLDELAHRISRSRPTATRTLRALTDLGLLKVVSPPAAADPRSTTCRRSRRPRPLTPVMTFPTRARANPER